MKYLARVPAEEVAAAFRRHYGLKTNEFIASQFAVTERTVRRWLVRGMPLYYSTVYVSRTDWEEFVKTGKSPRYGAGKPKVSARSSGRTGSGDRGKLSGVKK